MDNKPKALQQVHNLLNIQSENGQPFEALAAHLEHLINNDFNGLLSILYRIDVSEEKIKRALAQKKNTESAGETIANLLVERQLTKLKFRAEYKKKHQSDS
ncbi:MAG TPA: hypothetical protein VK021_02385 [Flavobacteriaceae bacterium]|nr:hypothetical protein [Flavobacteriaceae bacterium]